MQASHSELAALLWLVHAGPFHDPHLCQHDSNTNALEPASCVTTVHGPQDGEHVPVKDGQTLVSAGVPAQNIESKP